MARILITAGPTREHLDDVRFLSNGSSGRMGYAMAAAAAGMGCEVVLISGPVALDAPEGVRRVSVVSAREMLEACEAEFEACELACFVAAVCDHRPAERRPGKPPKGAGDGGATLELVPNPDIAASMGAVKGHRVTLGFALEAGPLEGAVARARAKLKAKNLDVIAVNLTSAMESERSQVTLVRSNGAEMSFPDQDKGSTAGALVRAMLPLTRWNRELGSENG